MMFCYFRALVFGVFYCFCIGERPNQHISLIAHFGDEIRRDVSRYLKQPLCPSHRDDAYTTVFIQSIFDELT